jgi:DnaJ-class molecular chaperone
MANFLEIDQARRLLGLGETATLKQIKQAYRRMAVLHHPDRSGGVNHSEPKEMMTKLNWAYKLLVDYCARYKYTFKEEDVARAYPYDEYLRKYYYGWFEGI